MNLYVQPKQFLFLYNSIKKLESEYMSDSDQNLYDDLLNNFENLIVGAFEDIDSREKLTGFDKWVKSETNKIKDLEDELHRIKVEVPQGDLLKKFTNIKVKQVQKQKKGRPRKSK